jgi:uncharacterized protein YecA (UPF0149 family)
MLVPAVCDNCGSFFPSGVEVKDSFHITFKGNVSGPCPKCGSLGHIPDGVYNIIGNTIKILSGPERTISELNQLAEILKQAKDENTSSNEVRDKIEEEAPEFISIKDFLPESKNELYVFITIILMIIQIIISQINIYQRPNITINQVFNILNKEDISTKKEKRIREIKKKKRHKIGRNDYCPCGSGKKFKKCCLGKRK